MKKLNKIKGAEILLLILVWMVLITAPVLFRNESELVWSDFINPLKIVIPLFVLFIINRFLLVPKLFFKNKRLLYLVTIFGFVASFTLGVYLLYPGPDKRPGRLPHEMRNQPRHTPPYMGPPDGNMPPPIERSKRGPVPLFANFLIFSILLVGFDTGLMTSFRLAKTEKEQVKLEKENAETQLAFLRNQVSPHFFMNTLNNIHSLIDIDTEEAKESIIRLSKLMRYLLYDSESEKIPIQKEMTFIRNYVDLMKLRFPEKVSIDLNLLDLDQCPDKSIPPLLFTSFVENAFKHGISYQKQSFIDIVFSLNENNLIFEIRNSYPRDEKGDEPSGIGIENSRKRLDLLYGDSYSLKIEEKNNEYCVILSIPI